ncbi:hypothetical protein PRZ48_006273 [Zasmidium cellare]|uniref:Uncharacterized protein n=1 Tax=Zasmidium cellare TaxID=395010 RepID=A0ABR0EMN5_ZASCE|nr:hypothetical protein PRZ48_006273 [Zasmidium cellare]
MAVNDNLLGDGSALQNSPPPCLSPRHQPISKWIANIDADRNIFESERDMNMSGTTLAGPQDNDCWMPHAHIGTFTRLTGEVASTAYLQESSPADTQNQDHTTSIRRDSVISQESYGDDGWNGHNASGLDLIDTRPDAAMEATLRAGAMAQLRRGLPSPPFTSADDFVDNYGMQSIEDPESASRAQDRRQTTKPGRQHGQVGAATSKSKEKVKSLFRRVFKCGKD